MAQVKRLALTIAVLLALPAAVRAQDAAVALDDQARVRMGEGDAAGALALMREQVASHPEDRDARFDLVRYLTWNGDFAGAEDVLAADAEAAASEEGRGLHAYLLAWAGRLDQSRELDAPLLAAHPDDFLLNYGRAVALRQSARPRAAMPYLETVQRLRPESKDARDLARGVYRYADSFVAFDFERSNDSIDLDASRPTLKAEIAQGEALRYTLEWGRWRYQAPLASPFAPIGGGDHVDDDRGLVGLRYAPSLRTVLSVAAGRSSVAGDDTVLWRAGIDQRVNDDWRLDLDLDHDRVAISPRALSLGLTRNRAVAAARWTPDLRWTGDASYGREHYSDGNDRAEWNLALRRAVVRRPHVSLDLGGAVQHLHYDLDPGNGYYAPDNYRRYSLTALAYFGFSDDVGLSVQAGLGRQRDETFSAWRRANDLSAELVIGAFSSWELRLRGAYSERVQTTGAYDGHSWGMALTRRFR